MDLRGSSAFTVVLGSRVSIMPPAPFLSAVDDDDDDDDDAVGGVAVVVVGGSVFGADTNAIAAFGGGETNATAPTPVRASE